MRRRFCIRQILAGLALALAAGCDGPARSVEDTAQTPAMRAAIAPQQFALVPCKQAQGASHPPCFVLAAGGKYFLMGAPDGAFGNLLASEVAVLDGVLLFRLLPDHLEGLDTVRNETWKRGRNQPLLVAGPEGTAAFAGGLDAAFEVPDAELFARESPPGGYDASLMKPIDVAAQSNAGTLVVNTGDLLVRGFYGPSGDTVYRVEYSGHVVAIGGCGHDADDSFLAELSGGAHLPICETGGETIYIIE